MTGIIRIDDNKPERIERFSSLESGQFWKALTDQPQQGISAGDVLLIESLRYVDDNLHTIILRAHPKVYGRSKILQWTDENGKEHSRHSTMSSHRFLYSEFEANFVYEPDHEEIRKGELAEAQGVITRLTQDLQETLSTPAKMQQIVAQQLEINRAAEQKDNTGKNLPAVIQQARAIKNISLSQAIDARVTQTDLDEMKAALELNREIAVIQSNWMNKRNKEIAVAIEAIQPFLEEMAAAKLATMEDATKGIEKLQQGIASMDLYLGKGVIVNRVSEGQSAPEDLPLTIMQKKLLVDEELAVYMDLGEWFDFSKIELFFEALTKYPGLVNQIFTTERCIVSMAVTRRYIDYKDRWDNAVNNETNSCVFLLARDGENIFQIYSPVESHLGSHRLFPSRDEQEAIFRGIDGEQINFNDVTYTDRLSAHERQALHYKRFLILICGLDHQMKLFGDFYDKTEKLSFVSMAFQERYFRFCEDASGEGLLADPELKKRPSLENYIADVNRHCRSGSRVLCHWLTLVNPDTAPGAARVSRDRSYGSGYEITVDKIVHEISVAVVYEREGLLYVDMPVSHTPYSGKNRGNARNYNVKVCLSKFGDEWNEDRSRLGYLCLDNVKSDELDFYINNRSFRQNFIYYMKLFKELSQTLREEEAIERPIRLELQSALVAGNIGDHETHESVIDKTIVSWRTANAGAPLKEAKSDKKAWSNLLAMMDLIAWRGASLLPVIESFANQNGCKPLRLIVNANAKLTLYMAPRDDERDDRAEPHNWVHRVNFNLAVRSGVKEASRSWTLLPAYAASETTIQEWPEDAVNWAGKKSVFSSYNEKQKVFSYLDSSVSDLEFIKPGNRTKNAVAGKMWLEAFYEMNFYRPTDNSVQSPTLAVPVGLKIYKDGWKYINIGISGNTLNNLATSYIYHNVSEEDAELKKDILDMYVCRFANEEGKAEGVINKMGELSFFLTEERPEMELFIVNKNAYTSWPDHGQDSSILEMISSFDTRFKMIDAAKGKNQMVWLASALCDENGEPAIDAVMGHTAPVTDPVDVIEFQLPRTGEPGKKATVAAAGYEFSEKHWFDICPQGFAEDKCLIGVFAPDKTVTRRSFSSREQAITWLVGQNKKLKAVSNHAYTHIEGVEIPDGIKRYRFYN